ncbi:hypothetical protein [Lysinibacillus fusiformis]|uniref:hypothetical protein n=1 Tax=Lysinibacillus fusiformis TaxID=28031 RepID=UPI0012455D3E|nr:hypothetical protein [Lysinibacillus fusiformis]KAB0442525.1 hypothetical protein CH314_14710 [Lysinibacillus fusiformis]
MQRQKSLFQGSRLYPQAKEGSLELLRILYSNIRSLSSKAFQDLTNGSEFITIKDMKSLDSFIKKSKSYVQKKCSNISAYHAIPILEEAVVRYYTSNNDDSLHLVGPGLKHTIAVVWNNLHGTTSNETSSLSKITEAVISCIIFEQISMFKYLYEVLDEFEIYYDGVNIRLPEEIQDYVEECNDCFKLRGRSHRTLNDSIQAIWNQPEVALESLNNILNGESCSKQSAFKGTIFERIPEDVPLKFWAGIWARLTLAIQAISVRNVIDSDTQELTKGICIFEPHLVISKGKNDVVRQQAIQDCFWNRTWYRENIKKLTSNMIVERPILRISINGVDLFSTTIFFILDSLNWFVESAVLGYPDAPVKLSSKVFENSISIPFESEVQQVLIKYGFEAGEVSKKQYWSNQGRGIVHNNDEKIPGQIDVLAYNEERKLSIVIDCKVLAYPYRYSTMKNIMGKTGSLDTEGFHSKLKDKINWLKNTIEFSGIPDINFYGLIVLDRKLPVFDQGEYPVVFIEELIELLERITKG